MQCPRSLVQLGAPIPTESGEDSRDFGTAVHYWKETGGFKGSDGHIRTLKKKIEASGINRDEWWKPGAGEHEVTFAVDLSAVTAVLHDPEEGHDPDPDAWKKAAPAHWLTGTIDWYVPRGDKPAWVDDLKTGRWPVNWATSRQLKSYALLDWVLAGCPLTGWTHYVSITQWPKYPLDALPKRTGGVLLGLDMAEHLEDLRWAISHPEEANAGDPAGGFMENPCTFCPNREEHPSTPWMRSWKYSRMPTCWEGAIGLLRDGKLQREEEE